MKANQIIGPSREIIRYAYGGFIAFLVAAIADSEKTLQVVKTLDYVLAPLCAIALGAFIYCIYKPSLGEFVYYPLAHWLHTNIFAKKWNYDKSLKKGYTCREHLLAERFGIQKSLCGEAYRAIRDSEDFNQKQRDSFHIQHSELHFLNITSTILFAAVIYLMFTAECTKGFAFLGVFVVVQVFELWSDILLCRQECIYVLSLGDEKIKSILKNVEILDNDEAS